MLDRNGYVNATIVPYASNLIESSIKVLVDQATTAYKPDPKSTYASYQAGDKVAACGGLGVLATVMGVKYGKTAAVGLGAALVGLLKYGGFLLALPFIWLARLFRRKAS